MKKVFVLLPALLAFVACGKFDGTGNGIIKVHVRSIATKGSIITTDSINEFVMDGWADDDYHKEDGTAITDHHYISSKTETVTKSDSKWSMSPQYNWLNGVNMRFWSYPKETKNAITITSQKEGQDNMSFKYSNTSADTDLLFAYNEGCCTYDGYGTLKSGDETLQIKFYHALAQLRFAICVSDLSFDKDQFDIVDITFGQIANGGTCTFNGTDNTFAWTPTGTGTSGVYTHSINADFSSSVPDGWTKTTSDGKTYYVQTEDVWFMLPQTTYSVAYAKITLKNRSDNTTFTKTTKIGGETWEAGKYYTFLIEYTTVHFDITVLKDDNDPYTFD